MTILISNVATTCQYGSYYQAQKLSQNPISLKPRSNKGDSPMLHLELRSMHWSSQFTLLKFLLSKIVWDGYDALSDEEEFVLIKIYDLLDSNTNFDFVRYYRGKLIKFSTIVTYYINCKARTFEGAQYVINSAAYPLISSGVLPQPHAYFGWVKVFNVKKFIRYIDPNSRGNKRRRRFIGVGYKDKGNMKDIANDNSPTWQEVAAVDLNLPPQRKETSIAYKLYLTNWGYRKKSES